MLHRHVQLATSPLDATKSYKLVHEESYQVHFENSRVHILLDRYGSQRSRDTNVRVLALLHVSSTNIWRLGFLKMPGLPAQDKTAVLITLWPSRWNECFKVSVCVSSGLWARPQLSRQAAAGHTDLSPLSFTPSNNMSAACVWALTAESIMNCSSPEFPPQTEMIYKVNWNLVGGIWSWWLSQRSHFFESN